MFTTKYFFSECVSQSCNFDDVHGPDQLNSGRQLALDAAVPRRAEGRRGRGDDALGNGRRGRSRPRVSTGHGFAR